MARTDIACKQQTLVASRWLIVFAVCTLRPRRASAFTNTRGDRSVNGVVAIYTSGA